MARGGVDDWGLSFSSFRLFGVSIVQLIADDISVHAFSPDDGSQSAAIKVKHRTSHHQVINNDTASQRENLRRGLRDLLASMNPNPDRIPDSKLMLFDSVRVLLPQSVHVGEIRRISWDFNSHEWKYFVECPNRAVTTWYVGADLEQVDESADEE